MTREEMEELNGLAASMGLYEDRNPCKRATILGKAIKELEQEPTTKNDLEVDWESYKDVDGNSLDDLILEVLQNNFDCGNTYGYKVTDEIIGLLPSVTPQEPALDKIREEIGKTWHTKPKNRYEEGLKDQALKDMQIIDKYKAESEDKE